MTVLKTLRYIHDNPGSTPGELSSKLNISRVSISKALKQLKKEDRIYTKTEARSTLCFISAPSFEVALTSADTLFVYFEDMHIGYLGFNRREYLFRYATEYLVHEQTPYRLTSIPYGIGTYKSETLFYDFDTILAEGTNLDILRKQAKSSTEFDLLPYISSDSMDIRFLKSFPQKTKREKRHEGKRPRFDEIVDSILAENDFPNIIDTVEEIPDDILFPDIINERNVDKLHTMSLSGYQYKFGMVKKDNGTFTLQEEGKAKTHFAKPYNILKADPASDYYLPHMAANEHLHMTFAKNELGFKVAESGLFRFDGNKEYHYITRLFDRYKANKFDCKEMSVFLGLNSENKYLISSEKLFKKAAEILLDHREKIVLLGYYFYSFVIKNADMHSKNLAVVVEYMLDGSVRHKMSPLYDISTTSIYGAGYQEIESKLSINGKTNNITYNEFSELVDILGVGRKEFTSEAKRILEAYVNTMPKYYDQIRSLDLLVYKNKYKPINFSDELNRAHKRRVDELYDQGWFHDTGTKILEATVEALQRYKDENKAIRYLSVCGVVDNKPEIEKLLIKREFYKALQLLEQL